jgi:hypothetical protein
MGRRCKVCFLVLLVTAAVSAQLKDADLYLNALPASTGECLRKVSGQIGLQALLIATVYCQLTCCEEISFFYNSYVVYAVPRVADQGSACSTVRVQV